MQPIPPQPSCYEPPSPDANVMGVYGWRYERFAALGYPAAEAIRLAMSRVDWHELESLIARGCTLEEAECLLL